MGVYIKNEKMPTTCSNCFYAEYCLKCTFGKIKWDKNNIIFYAGKKPDDCPLIEIKDE
jgi:hypothetical protein